MADKPTVYYDRPANTAQNGTIEIDFSRDLTLDHESEAPLLTLLSKLRSEKTATHEYKFAVGRFAPRTTTLNGNVTAGAVGASKTVSVAAGTGVYFSLWDLVEVEETNIDGTHTNQLIVTAISTDDLTCYAYDRATYGVAAAASGTTIRRVGSATREADSGRPVSQTVPTVYTQYIQTFEDYFSVSRLQDADRQYTGPERTRLREEARKKHILDQEYSMFFAKKVADTTTAGKTRYQMAGLISQITTNVLTYGAALSGDELFDFMIDVHNPAYSAGPKRMVLASGGLLSAINKIAINTAGAMSIRPKETAWGVNISEIAFAGKTWEFVEAPVLSEARDGWGVVIHPMFLKKRDLIPTMYEMNVQNPVDKFYLDGFYTATSVEVRMEEVFGLIKPA